jgi:hypothetical protein
MAHSLYWRFRSDLHALMCMYCTCPDVQVLYMPWCAGTVHAMMCRYCTCPDVQVLYMYFGVQWSFHCLTRLHAAPRSSKYMCKVVSTTRWRKHHRRHFGYRSCPLKQAADSPPTRAAISDAKTGSRLAANSPPTRAALSDAKTGSRLAANSRGNKRR